MTTMTDHKKQVHCQNLQTYEWDGEEILRLAYPDLGESNAIQRIYSWWGTRARQENVGFAQHRAVFDYAVMIAGIPDGAIDKVPYRSRQQLKLRALEIRYFAAPDLNDERYQRWHFLDGLGYVEVSRRARVIDALANGVLADRATLGFYEKDPELWEALEALNLPEQLAGDPHVTALLYTEDFDEQVSKESLAHLGKVAARSTSDLAPLVLMLLRAAES